MDLANDAFIVQMITTAAPLPPTSTNRPSSVTADIPEHLDVFSIDYYKEQSYDQLKLTTMTSSENGKHRIRDHSIRLIFCLSLDVIINTNQPIYFSLDLALLIFRWTCVHTSTRARARLRPFTDLCSPLLRFDVYNKSTA